MADDKEDRVMDWATRHGEEWAGGYVPPKQVNQYDEEGQRLNPNWEGPTFTGSPVGRFISRVSQHYPQIEPENDFYNVSTDPQLNLSFAPSYESKPRIDRDEPTNIPMVPSRSYNQGNTSGSGESTSFSATQAPYVNPSGGTFQVEGEGSPVRDINDDYWKTSRGGGNLIITPGPSQPRYIPGETELELAARNRWAAGGQPVNATPGYATSYYEAHPDEKLMADMQDQSGMTDDERSRNFRDRMRLESSFASKEEKAAIASRLASEEKGSTTRDVANMSAGANIIRSREAATTARQNALGAHEDRLAAIQERANRGSHEDQIKLIELGIKSNESIAKVNEINQRIEAAKRDEPAKAQKMQADLDLALTRTLTERHKQYVPMIHASEENIKNDPMNPVLQEKHSTLLSMINAFENDRAYYIRRNPNLRGAFPNMMPKLVKGLKDVTETFEMDGKHWYVTPSGIRMTTGSQTGNTQ